MKLGEWCPRRRSPGGRVVLGRAPASTSRAAGRGRRQVRRVRPGGRVAAAGAAGGRRAGPPPAGSVPLRRAGRSSRLSSARGARGFVEMDAAGSAPSTWRGPGSGGWPGRCERTGRCTRGRSTSGWSRSASSAATCPASRCRWTGTCAARRTCPAGAARASGPPRRRRRGARGRGRRASGLASPSRPGSRSRGARSRRAPFYLWWVTGRSSGAAGVRAQTGSSRRTLVGVVPAVLLGLVWPDARPTGRSTVGMEVSGSGPGAAFRRDGAGLRGVAAAGRASRAGDPRQRTDRPHPRGGAHRERRASFLGGEGTCSGQIALDAQDRAGPGVEGSRVRWPLGPGLNPVLAGPVRLVGPLATSR